MVKIASIVKSAMKSDEPPPDGPPADEWELIGTRVNGEEDYDLVSDWLRSKISDVEKRGLGDDPDALTQYVTGRTFQYMLVFSDPDGYILGIYRTLKTSKAANKDAVKSMPKKLDEPRWQLVGWYTASGGHGNLATGHGILSNVPKWVLDHLNEGKHYNGQRLRGKRFRYKIYCHRHSSGLITTKVWKKPRMWYWKKMLNANKAIAAKQG